MTGAVLMLFAQSLITGAGGIPQAVPPTQFACNMMAGDGSQFTVSGITPEFPKGWDPNSSKFVTIASTHPEAFQGTVGIDPGDAGEWFREFQVSALTKTGVRYTLQLMLRREGTSIAHATRYESTGKPIPYEYHSVGLCRAGFGGTAMQERG